MLKRVLAIMSHTWVRRQVPKDHTCLFASLVFLVEGPQKYNNSTDRFTSIIALRKHCADTVLSDPAEWPEWKLGREPSEYAAWIQKSDSWGGEIELLILCEKLCVEVRVVDMATQTIITYGEGAPGAVGRVHLLYTGQHYDPIVLVAEESTDKKGEDDIRIVSLDKSAETAFALDDEAGLKSLAKQAHSVAERKKRQRVVKKIKCVDCGEVLDNASAFQEHCMDEDIAHSEDFAYECEEVTIVMDAEEHSATLKAGAYDLESAETHTFYDIPAVPFSNSFPSPIRIQGRDFPTVEHYRQFRRFGGGGSTGTPAPTGTPTPGPQVADPSPNIAAQVVAAETVDDLNLLVSGKEKFQDPAWLQEDSGSSETLQMAATTEAMRAKFAQHENLRQSLSATGCKQLVCLGDDLWSGVTMRSGLPEGQNHCGKILMKIRTELGTGGGAASGSGTKNGGDASVAAEANE